MLCQLTSYNFHLWCALFENYWLQTDSTQRPDSRFAPTTSTVSLFNIDEAELFNFSDEVSHNACMYPLHTYILSWDRIAAHKLPLKFSIAATLQIHVPVNINILCQCLCSLAKY